MFVNLLKIWIMIVENVTDNKTLENLAVSSCFFRNMLMKRRVEFLAPEALKLVFSSGYLTTKKRSDLPNCYDQRRVCKSWCAGVDAYFDSLFTSSKPQFTSILDDSKEHDALVKSNFAVDSFSLWYYFGSNDASNSTGRNPFFKRNLVVNNTSDSPQCALQVLSLHGQHIWSLKYDMVHVSSRVLNEHLSRAPNLRRLEFSYISDYADKDEPLQVVPPLPKLATFKSSLKFALQSGIFHSCPSILNLHLYLGWFSGSHLLTLLSLKQLKLRLYAGKGLVSFNTPSLAMLSIYWIGFSFEPSQKEDCFVHWQSFFDMVNQNWGEVSTLTDVEIEMPAYHSLPRRCDIVWKTVCLRLQLSKVERLKLLLLRPCSLDFLLPMWKTLKYLRVRIKSQCVDQVKRKIAIEMQDVEFVGFEHRMLESNIWDLFPKLQQVVCEGFLTYPYQENLPRKCQKEVRKYTRAEWELSKQ